MAERRYRIWKKDKIEVEVEKHEAEIQDGEETSRCVNRLVPLLISDPVIEMKAVLERLERTAARVEEPGVFELEGATDAEQSLQGMVKVSVKSQYSELAQHPRGSYIAKVDPELVLINESFLDLL